MSELNIIKHTTEEIKERLLMIDWKNYELPEKTSYNELIKLIKVDKYNFLIVNLKTQDLYSTADDETKEPFFFFDSVYTMFNKNEKIYITCKNLVKKIRDVFYFNQKVSKMVDVYNAIDNQNEDRSYKDSKK